MVKTTLVNVDIDRGSEVLKALDGADLKVNVALWLYSQDYEDWRLFLSSRRLIAANLRESDGLVHDELDKAAVPLEWTPTLMMLPMNDPFVRELRRRFGNARDVNGMRLGGQMIADRWVEDAHVYRVS